MKTCYAKKITVLLANLMIFYSSYAQQAISPNLSKVLPPSPVAQAIERYGSYPVSLHTGIPDITVPIYGIKTSRLSLPINISFHPSGFKPKELDGCLGLAWTLNAGGIISREVRGVFDDQNYGVAPYFADKRYGSGEIDVMNYKDAFLYLKKIEENTNDAEYDIFSYSAAGISGKFILKGDNHEAMNLNSSKKVKIIPHLDPSTKKIESFDIIDENGQQHRFGKSSSDNTSAVETTQKPPYVGITGWMLTEIISADKTDTIKFKYNNRVYSPKLFYNNYITVNSNMTGAIVGTGNVPPIVENVENLYTPPYEVKSVSEIQFKDGIVKFNYSPDVKFLNSVEVYNLKLNLLNKTVFYNSRYGGIDDNHYKLDSLKKMAINQTYKFDYFNEGWLPSDAGIGGSEDWWGYYNGKENGPFQIPQMIYPGYKENSYGPLTQLTIGNANTDREANLHMQNFMLKKIVYPTGGSTEFLYETNKFKDVSGQIKNAGGLRISQIINSSETGKVEYKTYKYGVEESGYGNIFIYPVLSNLVSHMKVVNPSAQPFDLHNYNEIYTFMRTTVSPFLPQTVNYQMPVYYDVVTEYTGDGLINLGKTVNYFNRNVSDLQGYIPSYDNYAAFREPISQILSSWRPIFTSSQGMSRGIQALVKSPDLYGLIVKREYYKNINNSYSILKVDSSSYDIGTTGFAYSLNTNRITLGYDELYLGTQFLTYYQDSNTGPPFSYTNYVLSASKIRLVSSFETLNSPVANITTRTDYEYGSAFHDFPTKIKKTNSNGKVIERNNKYPPDKSLINQLSSENSIAIDSLVGKNMLNTLLEEEVYVNSEFTSRNRINFKLWDADKKIIKPQSIQIETAGYPNENRIEFEKYSNSGNILQQSKTKGAKTAYKWGYNNQYPILEIQNALETEFFYEDFEGNGTILSTPGTRAQSGQGGYSGIINLVNYFNPLTNGKSYKLAYNSYDGTKWNYIELDYTGQSISGIIDNIRIYPKDAQMTTFTYAPLIGMTSQTDPRGQTTYYEYDEFQRLKNVKDQNGNIIKNNVYHYKP